MKHFKISLVIICIVALFPTPSSAFYPLSPFSYCGGDPINYTDPSGCTIEGVRKKDAAMAVEDFRAMFPGEEFANFRNLIVQSGKKQNGKSLAPISADALSNALSGITLSVDQQALVDMVVNTINSDNLHMVEYFVPKKGVSEKSTEILSEHFKTQGIILKDGYATFIQNLCGEGATLITESGSLTVIQKNPRKFKTNRPATLGHEIMGHGRSFHIGYIDASSQHIIPIQIENLILRNMGSSLQRDGTDHSPLETYIPDYKSLPDFR